MAEQSLEITPAEVRRMLEAGENVRLIDVREPFEYQIAHLEGAALIPVNYVPAQLGALESQADDATLVIYCHHGIRSLNVTAWLRQQGVANCMSMAGGIDRWSLEIDPATPRY